MQLSMNLSQKQSLSQHMQQSAEILQMGALTLFEYIQGLAMENPVMEWEEPKEEQEYDKALKRLEWLEASDEQNKGYYQQEREDREENDDWRFPQRQEQTLEEYLLFQINILPIKAKQRAVLRFLAESILDSGYLEEDSLQAAKEQFFLSEQGLQKALKMLQMLEPPGVGARNLQECLLLQIQRKDKKYAVCEKIIQHYLPLLAKNQLHIIAKELKIKMVEVVAAKDMIKTLSPKPGRGFFCYEKTEYVLPDVILKQQGEEICVILNDGFLPKLKINDYYKEILLSDTSDAAKQYVASKIRQAQWVMQCIAKREATLLKTVQCIVQLQKPFFLQKQEGLSPMRLLDVAQKIGVHESTVSRAIKEKYLQCAQGVFPLSYFFTAGVCTKTEAAVSSDSVKKQIAKLIAQEDKKKPLSDRALSELLCEKGIALSRRTVAKYRAALGIAEASGRKVF